jgi:class 3 adenylate cyclase/tetratricopeptide (TPR) repeat protein
MRCPHCQHENSGSAKFCEECGNRLDCVCAHCATALAARARFCPNCGEAVVRAAADRTDSPAAYTPRHLVEKILTSRGALEGERKQVTVLFADVQGSLDLAGQVDAETWHGIMDHFFGILSAGVHRFEGTINQYTGDGIMALFGAPIAHEDHARRACYAALQLQEELRTYSEELKRTQGLNFSVRMGLNSGEVVVGKIGDDLRMDYTAQGHTVGLAARMEQLAHPGSAYLAEDTAKLVRGFFALRDLGPFRIKGVHDPVPVYELAGVGPLRTRLDIARARGLSRFVGREAETAVLENALARAIAGNGCVVGIVADAGLGKSRLCFEFAERCRGRSIEVIAGYAVPHGKRIPFLPLLQLLRDFCGITERDGSEGARRKIAGTLLLRAQEIQEDLPLLFDFLGVPDPRLPPPRMDPEARQRQLFSIVKRLIHSRSRGGPAVMLFEDLHWIDGASEAALEDLIEMLPSTRTLLVVNFRPEYHAAWMQKPYYQQLPLLPLGPEAIQQLLNGLLGDDATLGELAELIRARTGGNPFFVEEVVQSLVDHGVLVRSTGQPGGRTGVQITQPVTAIQIPPTVHAVLAARIDRLPDHHKQVLQTAAVIGEEFAEPVLRRAVEAQHAAPLLPGHLEAALHALAGAELIYERAVYPEAEYAFKHPLTQEVAYRSQLTERRTQVHAIVARAVAELYPDKLDEHAALLAHHWEGSGERLEAARWTRRAAEWVGYSDPAEAYRRWRRVRALLEPVAPSAETISLEIAACSRILNLGLRTGMSQEEAASVFARGRALAEQSGDASALARLHNNYGMVRGMAGETAEAIEHVMLATRMAEETDDTDLRLGLRVIAVVAHFHAGRLHEALTMTEESIELAGAAPKLGADVSGFSPYVFLVLYRGAIHIALGRLATGRQDLHEALRLAETHGELELLGMAHGFFALLALFSGESEDALAHAQQAIAVAEKIGSALSRGQAYGMLGTAHLLREEWDEAICALQQDVGISRERHTGLLLEAGSLALLSDAHRGRGDFDLARRTAEEALAVARRRGSRLFEGDAQLALARVLLATDGWRAREQIDRALTKAAAVVEQTGARVRLPLIHVERAELARLGGEETVRQRELSEALRLFIEVGATGHARRIQALTAA